MAIEATKIDRKKVEQFFTWEQSRALLITGVIIGVVGLLLLNANVLISLILLALGGFLIFKGLPGQSPLHDYYQEVVKAKNVDFAKVLIRSFNKTETDINSLLDFDAQDLVSLDLATSGESNQDLLTQLGWKSVYLVGRKDHGYLRWVRVDGRLVTEYSPIFVSILYLTKAELIVYFSSIDITRGDLLSEEVNRVFLKDIVEITSASTTQRLKRIGNDPLFKKYEKELKQTLPDEIVYREHSIRVTKTDGRPLSLPVGAPEYSDGTKGILDSDDKDDDRFSRVAREIFKRINDAKARV